MERGDEGPEYEGKEQRDSPRIHKSLHYHRMYHYVKGVALFSISAWAHGRLVFGVLFAAMDRWYAQTVKPSAIQTLTPVYTRSIYFPPGGILVRSPGLG